MAGVLPIRTFFPIPLTMRKRGLRASDTCRLDPHVSHGKDFFLDCRPQLIAHGLLQAWADEAWESGPSPSR